MYTKYLRIPGQKVKKLKAFSQLLLFVDIQRTSEVCRFRIREKEVSLNGRDGRNANLFN
jgi:hypothetical protein